MVGQYRVMLRSLPNEVERVNLVFMGMGEPLLNTEQLGQALAVLSRTVSPRRTTVSTAGVIPGIRWLAGLDRRPKLAVSLNAPDQERRERLMPIARRYPLNELLVELRRFPLEKGRRLTFEYVMIDEFNDRVDDALTLAAILDPLPAKINLIPLNPGPSLPRDLRPSPPARVQTFADCLRSRGLVATVRSSRGQDVAAACGQLKGTSGGAAVATPPDLVRPS
jgi:23S rRNA (adenine2503-C2)-methyltransferase